MSSSRADTADEELMARFQGGDRTAFALLVRRHQTALYNFALRQTGSGPGAEGAVVDTFVRVAQRAAEFKHAARFPTWLYAVAHTLWAERAATGDSGTLSSGQAELERTPAPEPAELRSPDSRPDAPPSAGTIERRERALKAMAALAAEAREVFLLRELAGLPFREIAAIVGVSEDTVKSRMRHALERLQATLADEEHTRGLR